MYSISDWFQAAVCRLRIFANLFCICRVQISGHARHWGLPGITLQRMIDTLCTVLILPYLLHRGGRLIIAGANPF
jgi:hypothetical protein